MPRAKRLLVFGLAAVASPLILYALVLPLLSRMSNWGVMLLLFFACVAVTGVALGLGLAWALKPQHRID